LTKSTTDEAEEFLYLRSIVRTTTGGTEQDAEASLEKSEQINCGNPKSLEEQL